ncbi:hypothetical protein BegalDRAFT_1744 [Beggiatoa alba B18LD]|uniref:Holliday junction resolvase n=1 Tax=Beggiatoa alba B18LD TaxID=395493 RepID=I3CG78_9GAMM|nr:hypothetical protein [Beggiatoa alba]EIJ42621.1 hypothetical protein BegalDRAFT_1744 [Beggiatoa alba B18LD]
MQRISQKIIGVPYGKTKDEIGQLLLRNWQNAIVEQTKNLPKIKGVCVLKLNFLLPADKFPARFPYGPDLEGLIGRVMDSLNSTIFSEVAGGHSCIMSLSVKKTKVPSDKEAGVWLEILTLDS